MSSKVRFVPMWATTLALCAATTLSLAPATRAQDNSDEGYQAGEMARDDSSNSADWQRSDEPSQTANEGPVRLARFAYVRGNVTWRGADNETWSKAGVNLPLRQGAQIWVTDGGRAELQFDDGSVLRLGNGALVTLQTLYSDQDGEFTQLRMTDGLATLRVRHERSVYQVDMPFVSVKAGGPSEVRLDVSDATEVAVQNGQATLDGASGKTTLQTGDYLDIVDAQAAYRIRRLPHADNWDRFNQDRDALMDGAARHETARYVPENIAIVSGELDDYGSWHDDSEYGHVWCPRVSASDWRPYSDGHWTWVNPFGWTWVSDEAWGWAPYHYGTWVSRPYGWGWVPGPVHQYWSPGVVHFCEEGGRVAWVPLAPTEVRYPSALTIGFRAGNWAALFSIGQAGVYYPSDRYCVGRPFRNTYVNHVTYVNNNYYNASPAFSRFGRSAEFYQAGRNGYLENSRFVPLNARHAGGSFATLEGFGGRGRYAALPPSQAGLFTRGRTLTPPSGRGIMPTGGPSSIRPSAESLSPSRTLLPGIVPPSRQNGRQVFSAPLPGNLTRRPTSFPPATRRPDIASPELGHVNRMPGAGRDPFGSRAERSGRVPGDVRGSSGPGTLPENRRGEETPLFRAPQGNSGSRTDGAGPIRTPGRTLPEQSHRLPGISERNERLPGSTPSDAARSARADLGTRGRGQTGGNGSASQEADRFPGMGGSRSNGYSRDTNRSSGSPLYTPHRNANPNSDVNRNSGSDNRSGFSRRPSGYPSRGDNSQNSRPSSPERGRNEAGSVGSGNGFPHRESGSTPASPSFPSRRESGREASPTPRFEPRQPTRQTEPTRSESRPQSNPAPRFEPRRENTPPPAPRRESAPTPPPARRESNNERSKDNNDRKDSDHKDGSQHRGRG